MMPLKLFLIINVLACFSHAFVPTGNKPTIGTRAKKGFPLSSSFDSTEEYEGGVATTPSPPPPPPPPPHKIISLKSLEDFLDYIDDAPKDSLSVVKYYAKSCPLCRRIEVKYKKMAHFYQKAPIRFAEIEKTAHPDLSTTLGVDRYPFIQIFRNGLVVASHGTESDKTFGPIVNDTIQRELMMGKEDWDAFLTTFAEPIRQISDKVQELRSLRTER